jgi:hypothetical protein
MACRGTALLYFLQVKQVYWLMKIKQNTLSVHQKKETHLKLQLQIGEYEFEKAEIFKYLGSLVTAGSYIQSSKKKSFSFPSHLN